MSAAAYERAAAKCRQLLADERRRHESAIAALRGELQLAEEGARIAVSCFDAGKILLAEHVIDVHGLYVKAGEDRAAQREAAIADILAGGVKLKGEYFGTKDYAHWHGQSSNHPYGYGPKHGSVIFSIGLTEPVRRRDTTPPLTEEEIEAAVYYLRNLEGIQATQEAAKSAAGVA